MQSALGRKIAELRKKRGLTLDQLAKDAGSSKSYIWEIENKTPPRPSAEKIAKIADVLGVEMQYLLGTDASMTEESAEDKAFFREYSQLEPEVKLKIRELTKLIGDG